MMRYDRCDQDATGAETAQVVVDTPAGELVLCQHHFNLNVAAFWVARYDFWPLNMPKPYLRSIMLITDGEPLL